MTSQGQPTPEESANQHVPWWLGRGAGLALLVMIGGVFWVIAWGVAAHDAIAVPTATAARWNNPEVGTTGLVDTDNTDNAALESTSGSTGRGTPGDDQTFDGTDVRAAPRPAGPSEPPPAQTDGDEHRLQAEVLEQRQQARIRRAQRRDRELAAFIETSGLVQELWVTPISSLYRITAGFGAAGSLWSADHTGVDLAAPTGTPVAAVAAGTVTSAGDAGAYGLRIALTHADGTQTWYAHLSSIDVTVGQQVTQGQLIGAVGSTGNSTGPHLHLELRTSGGVPVDPVEALRAKGVDLDLR